MDYIRPKVMLSVLQIELKGAMRFCQMPSESNSNFFTAYTAAIPMRR